MKSFFSWILVFLLSYPMAVSAELYRAEAVATADETRHDCKGENYSCSTGSRQRMGVIHKNCTRCATAAITLPEGAVVKSQKVLVKENSKSWSSGDPPYRGGKTRIGWSLVEEIGRDGNVIFARLKNWKHDRKRDIKLVVEYEVQ